MLQWQKEICVQKMHLVKGRCNECLWPGLVCLQSAISLTKNTRPTIIAHMNEILSWHFRQGCWTLISIKTRVETSFHSCTGLLGINQCGLLCIKDVEINSIFVRPMQFMVTLWIPRLHVEGHLVLKVTVTFQGLGSANIAQWWSFMTLASI